MASKGSQRSRPTVMPPSRHNLMLQFSELRAVIPENCPCRRMYGDYGSRLAMCVILGDSFLVVSFGPLWHSCSSVPLNLSSYRHGSVYLFNLELRLGLHPEPSPSNDRPLRIKTCPFWPLFRFLGKNTTAPTAIWIVKVRLEAPAKPFCLELEATAPNPNCSLSTSLSRSNTSLLVLRVFNRTCYAP